jgi:hypothetical protein
MLIKVPMPQGDNRHVYLLDTAVWAAIPEGQSVLLHLHQPMHLPHEVRRLAPESSVKDHVIAAHLWNLARRQGEVLSVRCSMASLCDAFKLVPFTATATPKSVPIGISATMIFAFSPAYDTEDRMVGSNLYLSNIAMPMNNVKVSVTESIEQVMHRIGVAPDTVVNLAGDLDIGKTTNIIMH